MADFVAVLSAVGLTPRDILLIVLCIVASGVWYSLRGMKSRVEEIYQHGVTMNTHMEGQIEEINGRLARLEAHSTQQVEFARRIERVENRMFEFLNITVKHEDRDHEQ